VLRRAQKPIVKPLIEPAEKPAGTRIMTLGAAPYAEES